MSGVLDPLKDTGDQDAIETPSPDELEAMSRHPATRLDVWAAGRKHAGTCTARKFTRQLRVALYVALGAFLTLQAGALLAGRAMLRDIVREAVRAEMGRPRVATGPLLPSVMGSAVAATEAP